MTREELVKLQKKWRKAKDDALDAMHRGEDKLYAVRYATAQLESIYDNPTYWDKPKKKKGKKG